MFPQLCSAFPRYICLPLFCVSEYILAISPWDPSTCHQRSGTEVAGISPANIFQYAALYSMQIINKWGGSETKAFLQYRMIWWWQTSSFLLLHRVHAFLPVIELCEIIHNDNNDSSTRQTYHIHICNRLLHQLPAVYLPIYSSAVVQILIFHTWR